MTSDEIIQDLAEDILCQVRGGRTPEDARNAMLHLVRRYVTNDEPKLNTEIFYVQAAYGRACHYLGVTPHYLPQPPRTLARV